MAQPRAVKVLEVSRVAPPPGTTASTAATSLPLTFYDILWLRFQPIERLFFYEFSQPTSSFLDSVLPKLKHSLFLTLQNFLPLAGNLTWPLHCPKPFVQYLPGDAVSLTIAKSDADFYHLSGTDPADVVECHPLIPHLTISHEQASIMALQVTLFPNSGFCVGIATHHAAVDGKSSISFMKSWAYTCSNLELAPSSSLPEHLTPFYDRSVIKDPTGISEIFVNAWLNQGGPNNRSLMVWELYKTTQTMIMGTFQLTPCHIQKLKQSAESKLNKKVHLSTFSVTCAYVLECLVKAERTEAQKVLFIFSVDCRSRLDPPIPPTYFGNCIAGAKFVAETERLMGKDGFVTALDAISKALNRLEDHGVLNGAESWAADMENATKDISQRVFSTAGSPRLEVYSADFGWGRPKKVEVVSIERTGAFSLSERRNGHGGIEIGLVLNKHVMEVFADLFLKDLESS